MAQRSNGTEKLDLRPTPSVKLTLSKAETSESKSISEFVLDAALREAEETLADRRSFVLDSEKFDRFLAALDAPPRRHPRLERLFGESSVLDPKLIVKDIALAAGPAT